MYVNESNVWLKRVINSTSANFCNVFMIFSLTLKQKE